MATFDSQKTSWTAEEAMHFARRAGFGISPERAAQLAQQAPAAVVGAWVDGGADERPVLAALPYADVVDYPGYGSEPDDWAPHPFRIRVERGWFFHAQAYWAWRMQYGTNPFVEKLALFWHNFFATGQKKVDNLALMLKQVQLFRDLGRGRFGDLLLAVSQDPAMLLWLDTVSNIVERPADVPNENYAREVLELYSLGVDNGYHQRDIAELAKAFTGWTFIGRDFPDPENPYYYNDGEFLVFRGQSNPYPGHPQIGGYTRLPDHRLKGSFTLFGTTLDLGAGSRYGADAISLILAQRGPQCAEFLARRILLGFLGADLPAQVLQDFKALILARDFQLGQIFEALFGSAYFYAPEHRFALVEGPAAWTVRAARALCPDFAAASAPRSSGQLPLFPAWAAFVNWDASGFRNMGQDLLNPRGPNGWREHEGWMNSDSYRHRTRTASAIALQEPRGDDHLGVRRNYFEGDWRGWFPAAPASARAVFDRLAALLQPAPIPDALRDAWLSRLWGGSFAWDTSAATERKVRRLAFLLLCSPEAQLH